MFPLPHLLLALSTFYAHNFIYGLPFFFSFFFSLSPNQKQKPTIKTNSKQNLIIQKKEKKRNKAHQNKAKYRLHFVMVNYFWAWVLQWRVFDIFIDTPLEKNLFFLSKEVSIANNFLLRGGTSRLLSSSLWCNFCNPSLELGPSRWPWDWSYLLETGGFISG